MFSSLKKLFPHVTKGSWNFSESGHGKGAPDGIGAVLRRTADNIIRQGKDIVDAHKFYEILTQEDLIVKLWNITLEDK